MTNILSDSTFRFRRHDRIGAAAAEQDDEFLRECFIDTGDLQMLLKPGDTRVIVLGRTGSGKSALLTHLKVSKENSVIELQPENLALSYLSNSTILQFFGNLGVNLDPFFKLLWRHVFTVEILSHHLGGQSDKQERNLLERLKALFPGTSVKEKRAREAIEYLTKWGENFWKETEYRVKEITQKVEGQLTAAATGKMKVPLAELSSSGKVAGLLSREQREELKERGQSIVSKAQVQDLSKVLDLLDVVLENRQHVYYLTVDSLDENWIEDRLRYKLIMALVLTAREFLKVRNAKVVVALRRDLMERVFRQTRDSGFQEEKYQSMYLPLEWTKSDLIRLLDKRINALVRRRYTKQPLGYKDLLPAHVNKVKVDDYLFERAHRPRDMISFFNTCIHAAEGKAKINSHALKKAEGEWSRSRFRALGDEWSADYPRLLDFAALLEGMHASFKLASVSEEVIGEFCLKRAAEEPAGHGVLQEVALQVVNMTVTPEEARRQIVRVFYLVGLVGLKLAAHETVSWVDQLGRSVPSAEIGPETSVVTHPALHRELGIKPV